MPSIPASSVGKISTNFKLFCKLCGLSDDGWWCVVKEQHWGTTYEVNLIVKYNREITWQSSLQEILVCGYSVELEESVENIETQMTIEFSKMKKDQQIILYK